MQDSLITRNPELVRREEFYKESAIAIKQNGIDDTCFEKGLYSRATFDFLLHFLPHYPYEIKKPISVSIEKSKDQTCFIIACEEFNKFGIGLTKDEAVEDFEHSVITDYLLLNESDPEELSIGAKQLLESYRTYIVLT